MQYHQSVIDHAREAEQAQTGRPLAIALDTVSWVTSVLSSLVVLTLLVERT